VLRPNLAYWVWMPGIAILFPIVIVVIVVASFVPDGDAVGRVIALIWAILAVLVVASVLLRICSHVELTGNELRWRAPLRGGVVPLATIRSIRKRFFSHHIVIRHDGGRVVLLRSRGAAATGRSSRWSGTGSTGSDPWPARNNGLPLVRAVRRLGCMP
jgi:hypothetical protein